MYHRIAITSLITLSTILVTPLSTGLAGSAFAAPQDERPAPGAPRSQATEPDATVEPTAPRQNSSPTRPEIPSDPVTITWQDVGVKETFTFIAENTGKVVIPVNILGLGNKKFTLRADKPVPRSHALDLLFQALRLNDVAIVETEDVVIIGLVDDLTVKSTAFPIIPAEESVLGRADKGSLVVKFVQCEFVKADDVLEQITAKDGPASFTITADPNSNQLVVWGDIGYCQYVEKLALELDDTHVKPRTETFRLRYADATDVSNNILDLFEDTGTGGTRTNQSNRQQSNRGRATGRPGGGTQSPTQGSVIGPDIELRVTVNAQQNSVTVGGDPKVIQQIAGLIDTEWDLPRSTGTSRIYTLIYTDPIKVADKINALLGQASSTGGGGRAGGGRGGAQGGGDASEILSGIYQIEAFPDSNQVLVFAKTEESLDFLSGLIEKIDQPTPIGLPFVVELKHADAFELAEQLNALLAEAGAGATIRDQQTGLSGGGIDDAAEGGAQTDAAATGTIQFPWQRGGRQAEDVTPESALIGRVRIVPISRMNALAILCPKPQEMAVEELVSYFDRPGRQVMIKVVLAEVQLQNNLSLGLRLSSSEDIGSLANPDNAFAAALTTSGSDENPWDNLFDTSVLDVSANLNAVIQALDQDNNLRIIQQPVIFTADNQEAYFFDGQEIPFITNTTINTQGNPTDSFEYKNVGLILNVRPRITKTRDVDLQLRLELSAVVPGQVLFGGAIIDRRTTTTHTVVKNGQTIVLSGILKESESRVERGVPFLSDIPIIGELFKSRDFEDSTSELVAFITPMVVSSPEENDTNFQEGYRQRLQELTLPLEEQQKQQRENPDMFRDRMRPDPQPILPFDAESIPGSRPQGSGSDAEVTNLEDILMEKRLEAGEARRRELEDPDGDGGGSDAGGGSGDGDGGDGDGG